MNRILKIVANDLAVLATVLILICVAAPAAHAIKACCQITSINTRTGIVTAKVNTTGQTLQFSLMNRAQLNQLQVGQALYANFKANQVSLDGKTPAGMILTAAPLDGAVARGTQAAPLDGVRITSIDTAQGKVTVQLLATGEQIYFNIPSSNIQAHRLAVGQNVRIGAMRSLQMGGTCPCGQHTDGTCACACGVPGCTGPCKVGECRNGVKGLGGGVPISGGPTAGNTLSAQAAPATNTQTPKPKRVH
jgi:hypothetical protein